jgi:hypothetical protein
LLNNLTLVEEMIVALNKGAHPSGLMMVQVSTETAGMRQLGGSFRQEILGACMNLGTLLMALLLYEIARIVPVDDVWQAEFSALGEGRREWHQAAFGGGSEGNGSQSPAPASDPQPCD